MTDLPVDIDPSYLDQSPGDAAHQQHHDKLHDLHNKLAGANPDVAAVPGLSDALATYVSQDGGDTITASDPAVIPLVVKGAADQTASLFEARNDAGAVVAEVKPAGTFTGNDVVAKSVLYAGGSTGPAAWTGAQMQAVAADPARKGLVVKGAPSQTGNLQEWQNSAGTVLARVTSAGSLYAVLYQFGVGPVGVRELQVDAADSAGAGFRNVRVAN